MEIRAAVLARAASGENDSSIARALGLPRATVRGMRRRAATVRPVCPRCWRRCREAVVPEDAYAEVLGLYLGDGCISRLARTFRLRLSLDSKYPELVAASRASIARVLPVNRVSTHREDGGNTTILTTHSGHLPCLFPQHGPGKKHHRLIALEGWQRDICLREPFALLRGTVSVRRVLLHQPDGALRLRVLRLQEQLGGHHRHLLLGLRGGRSRAPPDARPDQDKPPGERRADARARRPEGLSAATILVAGGCGEIGIHAGFRCPWAQARGGSSPLSRTLAPRPRPRVADVARDTSAFWGTCRERAFVRRADACRTSLVRRQTKEPRHEASPRAPDHACRLRRRSGGCRSGDPRRPACARVRRGRGRRRRASDGADRLRPAITAPGAIATDAAATEAAGSASVGGAMASSTASSGASCSGIGSAAAASRCSACSCSGSSPGSPCAGAGARAGARGTDRAPPPPRPRGGRTRLPRLRGPRPLPAAPAPAARRRAVRLPPSEEEPPTLTPAVRSRPRPRGYTPYVGRGGRVAARSTLRTVLPPSSRGLGRRPLTAETGVRIPVAVLPKPRVSGACGGAGRAGRAGARAPGRGSRG